MYYRKIVNAFRFWLLRKLFTESEKYLLLNAMDYRIENLERISVTERWADRENIAQDVSDYRGLRYCFSTDSMY